MIITPHRKEFPTHSMVKLSAVIASEHFPCVSLDVKCLRVRSVSQYFVMGVSTSVQGKKQRKRLKLEVNLDTNCEGKDVNMMP